MSEQTIEGNWDFSKTQGFTYQYSRITLKCPECGYTWGSDKTESNQSRAWEKANGKYWSDAFSNAGLSSEELRVFRKAVRVVTRSFTPRERERISNSMVEWLRKT